MTPSETPGADPTPDPAQANARGRVLAVDDDEDIRKLIQRQLAVLGYDCTTVSSAEEALSQVRAGVYDLILTDIGMPEMNGLELLREIRRIDRNVLVVMVTASRSINHALDALKNGAVDYIVKPFDIPTLSSVVARVLERKKPASGPARG